MSNLHEIGDFFKEKTQDFALAPSANAWQKLADKLAHEQPEEKTTPRIAYLKIFKVVGLAASLLLLVGAFYQFEKSQKMRKEQAFLVHLQGETELFDDNINSIISYQLKYRLHSKQDCVIPEGKVGQRLQVRVN